MAPAPPAAGMKALNANHYTLLAALTAAIAAAVIVTVIFIVLSPARIQFSVTQAGYDRYRNGSVQLILTVAANNTSQRARVTYQSIFIGLKDSTGPEFVYSIRANVTTSMPLRQPRASVATVNATVLQRPGTEAFTGNMTCTFSVLVGAVVRFKVGIAATRLYDIKVICRPVSFFNVSGAAPSRLPLPVLCF